MATPVTMPMLGLTMEEGTVAEWLKQQGEAVKKDEPPKVLEGAAPKPAEQATAEPNKAGWSAKS